VSGKLFSGDKIRDFQGDVLFEAFNNSKLRLAVSENKKIPVNTTSCRNWGVVNSNIDKPTAAVLNLAKLRDWCVVVVGDKRTSVPYVISDELKDDIVYLGMNHVERLVKLFDGVYSELLSLTPLNHLGRKNIGYLFAIQQGAK
jgi:hypothetical protein